MTTRVALVTGAAGGVGSATCDLLTAAGWRVVGVDRNDVVSPSGQFWVTDLRRPEAVHDVTARVSSELGRLDLLVNNAALQVARPIEQTSDADWDELLAVNLRAPFFLVKGACDLLAATHGSVVNIASVHAIATSSGMAAYAASKGGLVAMTRSLAIELAPRGIRVNAVLPGAVDTPMLDAGLSRDHLSGSLTERKGELAARTAAGRIGRPEEIAQAVLFLADPERAGFVTGQCLVVDGGATARLSTE